MTSAITASFITYLFIRRRQRRISAGRFGSRSTGTSIIFCHARSPGRSWLALCDTRQYNILLTSYSDLARDETAYINQILDFHGIPRSLFRRPQIEKTVVASHYRVGSENEWLTAFNAGQIAKSTAMIGDDLIERFGWDRVGAARMAS